MKPLVISYSRNGSCSQVADLIGETIGASDVRHLKDSENRRGILGFLRSGFQAASRRPATLLGDPWEGIEPGRHVYLVAPIWAGKPNPVLRAFLDGAKLDGISVHLVTVQADPKHSRSTEVFEELSGLVVQAGGTVVETAALTGAPPGKAASPDALRAQVTTLISSDRAGE